MNQKSILIVCSLALLTVLTITSAFTDKAGKATNTDNTGKAAKQTVYEHFQYIGANYNEAGFENSANWDALGTTNPSTSPCASGSTKTCVLRIEQSELSGISGATMEEKIANYLLGEPSAFDIVDDSGNSTYRKD